MSRERTLCGGKKGKEKEKNNLTQGAPSITDRRNQQDVRYQERGVVYKTHALQAKPRADIGWNGKQGSYTRTRYESS